MTVAAEGPLSLEGFIFETNRDGTRAYRSSSSRRWRCGSTWTMAWWARTCASATTTTPAT